MVVGGARQKGQEDRIIGKLNKMAVAVGRPAIIRVENEQERGEDAALW